jgi:conjugal transfer pilus assembly protein TraF
VLHFLSFVNTLNSKTLHLTNGAIHFGPEGPSFLASMDKISRAFAVVAQAFASKHHWKMIGIAMDGVLLKEVDHNLPDNGVSKKIALSFFPALVAVNPKTDEVIPLAFGLRSLDQIENNVFLQFNNILEDK